MSELLTFGEAKQSLELSAVAGSCSNTEQFRSYLNQATRKLMKRGSWWGTVQKIQVCVSNNCVVWPRFVGTVLATNINGRHVPVKDNWYGFLPIDRCDFGAGGLFPFLNGGFGSGGAVANYGVSPVFNPISCGHPVYIQVYPSVRADIGKTTTIYGIDSNGQTIRSKDINGIWQEGITLTIALPFTQTPIQIREVTRISKDVTQGVVRYYQFNPIGNSMYDLVYYDPGETNPMYRSTKIFGPKGGSCCSKSIQALVKLEFVPVVSDTDIVQIADLDSLAMMIMSLRSKEAGDIALANQYEIDAVRELNLELRNKFPNDQIATNVSYFGTADLRKQKIGSLI